MHVCVIGAGVIGVTTAWTLARRGWQVSLLDTCPQAAAGASHANGGQLSYSYVAPLAGPGVLPHVPSWLLRSDSPLRVIPRLDPQQWRWSMAFVQACRSSVANTTTAQMLALASLSRRAMDAMLAETPIAFGHTRNGKMILYRNGDQLDKARALVDYQATLGATQSVLNANECVDLEPSLAPIRQELAGAIFTPSEEAGDCRLFTQALYQQLQAMPNVDLRMNTTALRLRSNREAISTLQCHDGSTIQADHYVVCAGMGSQALLRPLGINPMLYPLKGYSLDIPCSPGQAAPSINVTDYERRTVYARLNGSLRVAAMVGIGIKHQQVEPRRLSLLKRQIHELLPNLDLSAAQAWAGHRPSTPDGKPVIGQASRLHNLWLNTGHGALGFTLACGSARLISQLIAAEPTEIDMQPFSVR